MSNHTLTTCFTATDCADCGQCDRGSRYCDMPGGNEYTCGVGDFQFNRRVSACVSIPPGEMLTIDLSAYEQSDGSVNSMDVLRRFYLVNRTPRSCRASTVQISGSGVMGQASPGNDVFISSHSTGSHPAGVINMFNPSVKSIEVCYSVLGVKL